MALTNTTLTAALGANALKAYVASATGATVGGFIKINGEYMVVTEILGLAIGLRSRGDRGGKAVEHPALSTVTFGVNTDLPVTEGPGKAAYIDQPDLVTVSADGAIPVPTRDTIVRIQKGSAAVLTLANPSLAADGLRLTIVSGTAFAHAITVPTGFHGAAGNDRATFTAVVNATLPLIARGGTWAIDSVLTSATAGLPVTLD